MIMNVYVQNKNHEGKTPAYMIFQVDGGEVDNARQDVIDSLTTIPQRVLMEIPKVNQNG